MWKYLSLAKHIRKLVAISFRQSHTRARNLVKYHPRVVFTESFHAMVSTDEGGVLNSRSLHRHIEDIRKDFNYSSVNVNIFSETRLNCSDKDTDYAIILKLFPVYSKNPFVLGYRVCKNTKTRDNPTCYNHICIPLPKSTSESNVSGIDANFDFVSWARLFVSRLT